MGRASPYVVVIDTAYCMCRGSVEVYSFPLFSWLAVANVVLRRKWDRSDSIWLVSGPGNLGVRGNNF